MYVVIISVCCTLALCPLPSYTSIGRSLKKNYTQTRKIINSIRHFWVHVYLILTVSWYKSDRNHTFNRLYKILKESSHAPMGFVYLIFGLNVLFYYVFYVFQVWGQSDKNYDFYYRFIKFWRKTFPPL